MGWPSDRAWRMLEAVEADASDGTDHETLDVLLSVWDISGSFVGDGMGARRRYHPRLPNYPFSYPLRRDLPADLVLAVCARIRDLYRKVVIDE